MTMGLKHKEQNLFPVSKTFIYINKPVYMWFFQNNFFIKNISLKRFYRYINLKQWGTVFRRCLHEKNRPSQVRHLTTVERIVSLVYTRKFFSPNTQPIPLNLHAAALMHRLIFYGEIYLSEKYYKNGVT